MAYTLEAILGSDVVVRHLVAQLSEAPAVVVSLDQGIGMVPMTDELFDAVTEGTADHRPGLHKLPESFEQLVADASRIGPVAYVEAELFGGVGSQCAVVWIGGHVILGPLTIEESEPFPVEGSPISQALRILGVKAHGHFDEFDAVGLSAHRSNDSWLRHSIASMNMPAAAEAVIEPWSDDRRDGGTVHFT
jgi:hypothetical protein